MRPLTLLGLVAGLAMLGWGGYALYAVCVGGPELYWGGVESEFLREAEVSLESTRTTGGDMAAKANAIRQRLGNLPPGALREKAEKAVEKADADRAACAVKRDEFQKRVDRLVLDRDEARGRNLRRGILFTLLGVAWSVRAGSALVAPSRRAPSTAAPGPSPPSPRPGG